MSDLKKHKPRKEWLVIVNPNAGKKKGEKDWKEISKLLQDAGFVFQSVFTEHRDHAIRLTTEHINDGYDKVIVVGGDGTLNEVANGIFQQSGVHTNEVTLGMITVGTGNDWGRMYKIPDKYHEAVKVLKEGITFIQDAGKVTYHHKDEKIERYFVNMAGMGYDALVAKKTNLMKEKGGGGALAYLFNLLTGLFQYKQSRVSISIDNQFVFSGEVFSLSIGICKYNGGGMMQLPNAIPDDSLFDMTIIKNASKWDVVKNIKKLYDGSFLDLPIVETHVGDKIRIISQPKRSVFLETDGESLGHSPLDFEIIPKSIKLIVKKGWER